MTASNRRYLPPFDPGQIVHFKIWDGTPPNSDGPKVVRAVRWVNQACQSGYLVDVRDQANPKRRWTGYDSTYFEVRE